MRNENQDALCLAGTVRTGEMTSCETFEITEYPALLAVVDGMGGYEGGALSARIVAETFADASRGKVFSGRFDRLADEDILRELLKSAADRMASAALERPNLAKMGSALSGILLRENTALAFNCGDCRAYRISHGVMERLTKDHSIVQALYERGEIDEEGMRAHPRKNIVTSAVFANPDYEPELYSMAISRVPQDEYFLCSDGVWEAFSTAELSALLSGPFPDSADTLLDSLLFSGCRDNVSFIWEKPKLR